MQITLHDNFEGKIYEDKLTSIWGIDEVQTHVKIEGGGCFGFVAKGFIVIGEFVVPEGFWFTTEHEFNAVLNGRVALWQTKGYHGTLSCGKWESDGRLNYIDGAKDSVLVNPLINGDPCLNALYMPTGVNQTMHTHPSLRSGYIINGGGRCETPLGTVELKSDCIFILLADAKHKFRTDLQHEGDIMKLIAYHPDSDFGAKHENHPMLNRTIVNGISANEITEIQTK